MKMRKKYANLVGVALLVGWAVCTPGSAAETAAAAPATRPASQLAKPAALPAGARAIRDIRYGDAEGKGNLLDLYLPASPSGSPLPLVVYIHGGGWRAGDKSPTSHTNFVLENGYAFASINYRFSQEAVFPAQLDDCKAALRWLRAHAKEYNIDVNRIGLWGSSAGAHLAALLAMTDEAANRERSVRGEDEHLARGIRCVVDFYGPSDFVNMEAQAKAAGIVRDPKKISVLLGGTPEEKPELAAAASPVRHVTKATPPFLILHGGADKTVPLAQSEEMAETLKKAGVDVTLTIVAGAAHGAPFSGAKEREEVKAFLDKHLKATAAGQ
jgi:acetyl esterase/lipase